MAQAKPSREAARLAALRRYDILDSRADPAFDAMAQLAATLSACPIALISFVDAKRKWLKANVGLPGIAEIPRAASICNYTITQTELVEVEDARKDARFEQLPVVAGHPFVRFYAGVPILTDDGHAIGTLCIIDRAPRKLSKEQREGLRLIGKAITDLVQSRVRLPRGEKKLSDILALAIEDAADMVVVTDNERPPHSMPHIVYANKEFLAEFGYSAEEVIGKESSIFFGPGSDSQVIASISDDIAHLHPHVAEFLAYRKDGSTFTCETRSKPVFDADGNYINRVILASNISDRKRSQLELQTLRALIDEATDFIFTTDAVPTAEGGPYFTYMNGAMLRETGYTLDEVIGRSPTMFFGPNTDKRVVQEVISGLEERRATGAEFQIHRKDGSSFWVEFNGRPIMDKDTGAAKNWIAVGRDITARRETQQRLLVLQTAMAHASDCIVVYDIDPTRHSKPEVVFVNDATIQQSGWSREELMSGPTGTGPETDQIKLSAFRNALMNGQPARTRLRLYRKDGSSYWGEISARPIKNQAGEVTNIVSIERDVSDVVAREKQLETDNQTLAALMQVSRELFGVLSSESLRQKLLSGIETLTSFRPIEHPGVLALADPFLQRAATSRVPLVDRTRERAAFSIPGTADAPASVVEINASATGRKLERSVVLALQLFVQNYRTAAQNTALYEEIEDRRAAVIELNQTKSDLIAMLAHDFRGPMTSIMGFAELLRNEELDRAEQIEFLDTIISATQRLTTLASDTLAMSRLEENELQLTLEPVDYIALLNESAQLYRDERPISIESPQEKMEGRGDVERLRQVFDNLIGNAIKYSPGGGEVKISIEAIGPAVQIRIKDEGIGIPPTELSRVFTRFSRASNARASGISGTGFGLYLSKQIVERHGGVIDVESVVGVGSTFIITIPLSGGAQYGPMRLLVGDHEGTVRSFTAHTLRSNGFTVKVCTTFAELEAEVGAQSYDLAVVDAETFRASSTTIQQFIDTANAVSIPVIIIGASRIEQLEGYAATLRKPYLVSDLMASISRFDHRSGPASNLVTKGAIAEPR